MIGPFIQYHKIDLPPPDAKIRGGYTPAKRFAKQMLLLKKQGFTFYTASEMMEIYLKQGEFPQRGLTITFDDGWKDNYDNAFPVLRELGINATIFLISSCLGNASTKAQSEGESQREHLTLDNVLEMSAHGIEFGSHTVNHKLLDRIPLDEVKSEVEDSKRQLEDMLKKPCKVFAYPGGHFNEASRMAVEDAGYLAGFSTIYGPRERLDLHALNRVEILRRDRFQYQFARKVKPFLENGR